jgi:hypothetical protein
LAQANIKQGAVGPRELADTINRAIVAFLDQHLAVQQAQAQAQAPAGAAGAAGAGAARRRSRGGEGQQAAAVITQQQADEWRAQFGSVASIMTAFV